MKDKLHRCPECKTKTTLRVKLGGLVCNNCDIIVFYPQTPEYDDAWIRIDDHLIELVDQSRLEWENK